MSSTSSIAAVEINGYTITQEMLDAVTNPFLKMDEAEILVVLNAKETALKVLTEANTDIASKNAYEIKSWLKAAGYTESEIAAMLRREATNGTDSDYTAAVLALVKSKIINRDSMWQMHSNRDLIDAIAEATGQTWNGTESLGEFFDSSGVTLAQISGSTILKKFFNGLTLDELLNDNLLTAGLSVAALEGIINAELAIISTQKAALDANAGKFFFLEGHYDQIVLQQIYEALTSKDNEEAKVAALKDLYGEEGAAKYLVEGKHPPTLEDGDDYWLTGKGAESVFGRLKQAEIAARETPQYIALYGKYDATVTDDSGNPVGTKENPAEGSLWYIYKAAEAVKEKAYDTVLTPDETLANITGTCNAAFFNQDENGAPKNAKVFDGKSYNDLKEEAASGGERMATAEEAKAVYDSLVTYLWGVYNGSYEFAITIGEKSFTKFVDLELWARELSPTDPNFAAAYAAIDEIRNTKFTEQDRLGNIWITDGNGISLNDLEQACVDAGGNIGYYEVSLAQLKEECVDEAQKKLEEAYNSYEYFYVTSFNANTGVFDTNVETYTSIAELDKQYQKLNEKYENAYNTPIFLQQSDPYSSYNGKTINEIRGLLSEPEWDTFREHIIDMQLFGGGKTIKTLEQEYNEAKIVAEEAQTRYDMAAAYLDLQTAILFNDIKTNVDRLVSDVTTFIDCDRDGMTPYHRNLVHAAQDACEDFKKKLTPLKTELNSYFADPPAPVNLVKVLGLIKDVNDCILSSKTYSRGGIDEATMRSHLQEIRTESYSSKNGEAAKSAAEDVYNDMMAFNDLYGGLIVSIMSNVSLDELNLPAEEYALLYPYFSNDGVGLRDLTTELKAKFTEDFGRVISSIEEKRNKTAAELSAADNIRAEKEAAYKNALIVDQVNGPYNEILAAYHAAYDAYLNGLSAYEALAVYENLVRAQLLYQGELKALAKLEVVTGATVDDLLNLCTMASTPTPNANGDYKLVSGVKKIGQTGENGKVTYRYELVYAVDNKNEDIVLKKADYDASFSKEDGYAHLALPYFSLAIMFEKVCIQQMVLAEQIKQIEKINEEIKTNNEMIKTLSWMYEKAYAEAAKSKNDNRQATITNDEAKTQCGVSIRELDDYMKNVVKNGGFQTCSTSLQSNFTTSYGVDMNGSFRFAVSHYDTEGNKWTDDGSNGKYANVDVQEQATLTDLSNRLDQVRLYGDQLSTDANLMTTKMQQYVQETNACLNACSQTVKSIGDYYKTIISNIR